MLNNNTYERKMKGQINSITIQLGNKSFSQVYNEKKRENKIKVKNWSQWIKRDSQTDRQTGGKISRAGNVTNKGNSCNCHCYWSEIMARLSVPWMPRWAQTNTPSITAANQVVTLDYADEMESWGEGYWVVWIMGDSWWVVVLLGDWKHWRVCVCGMMGDGDG